MRTTWNGAISFGLVAIPVALAPATKPTARQADVSFRLLHRECGTPIKQKKWCPYHEREVSAEEVVRGWEVSKGEFVLVEEAELEALERETESRAIEIERFVPAQEVDPIYFDRHYFLVPGPGAAARRPYVLLLEAMRETGTVAFGRFVLAGRERLALIRPRGDVLLLETLFAAEDVYSDAEIAAQVAGTETKEAEVALARQVVEALSGDLDPAQLVYAYRRDLRALLEEKLAQKLRGEAAAAAPPPPQAPVIDLMEALRRSVAEAKKRTSTRGAGKARVAPSGARKAARRGRA
jgi:DNA end-binding protein Ku